MLLQIAAWMVAVGCNVAFNDACDGLKISFNQAYSTF